MWAVALRERQVTPAIAWSWSPGAPSTGSRSRPRRGRSASRRAVRPDDDAVTARARRVEHGRRSRDRRALARADDRAHGLHAGPPSLRPRSQAELQGRPRRRPDPRHCIATSRSSSRRAGSAACARTSRTHGSAFATRVQAEHWLDVGRGDAVWCTTESVGAHDVEHRHRAVVTGRRGRRSRTARSTPTSGSICSSGSGRASSASLRPSTACSPSTRGSSASGRPSPAARVHRRLPRSRGRRGLRGTLGHDHRRWVRPGRDEHRRREPRRRTVKPAPSDGRCPATTSV